MTSKSGARLLLFAIIVAQINIAFPWLQYGSTATYRLLTIYGYSFPPRDFVNALAHAYSQQLDFESSDIAQKIEHVLLHSDIACALGSVWPLS
jgi:hypothetical protein